MPRKTTPLPQPLPLNTPASAIERPKLSAFQAVVQSEGFKEVIAHLEKAHPRHKGLAPHATMEQRAAKQIGDQQYETIMVQLRSMTATGAYPQFIESTYEEIK